MLNDKTWRELRDFCNSLNEKQLDETVLVFEETLVSKDERIMGGVNKLDTFKDGVPFMEVEMEVN